MTCTSRKCFEKGCSSRMPDAPTMAWTRSTAFAASRTACVAADASSETEMQMTLSSDAGAIVLSCCLLTACAVAPPADALDRKSEACARPIPEIYEQASPVVVTITAQSINPFRLQDRVSHSLGSGFIIQNDGLILTNSHVVYGKQSLTVTLDDGSTVPARIVGADPI